MERDAYRLLARTIKALAHPTRLAILSSLREGEVCVCDLEPALDLRQANISQHLAVLRRANLVISRREGLRIFYRVSDERVFEALDLLSSIARERLVEATEALASLMPSNLQAEV
ncbi:MAG: metalloregulator ArsR/SmtB family transcription factor [Anaerolineae bacterium]